MRIQSIALSSAVTAALAAGIATMPLTAAAGAGLAPAATGSGARAVPGGTRAAGAHVHAAATLAGAAATLAAWPVLREGPNPLSPVATVTALQYLLNAHGATLTADGAFGLGTGTAVRAFQRSQGIPATGVVRGRTWRALVITSKLGSSGPAVRAIQAELDVRSPAIGPAVSTDGIYGPHTQAAVRAFQAETAASVAGFPVDGVVGPLTWQALVTSTP